MMAQQDARELARPGWLEALVLQGGGEWRSLPGSRDHVTRKGILKAGREVALAFEKPRDGKS